MYNTDSEAIKISKIIQISADSNKEEICFSQYHDCPVYGTYSKRIFDKLNLDDPYNVQFFLNGMTEKLLIKVSKRYFSKIIIFVLEN